MDRLTNNNNNNTQAMIVQKRRRGVKRGTVKMAYVPFGSFLLYGQTSHKRKRDILMDILDLVFFNQVLDRL